MNPTQVSLATGAYVGQRVRMTRDSRTGTKVPKGAVGTVVQYNDGYDEYRVRFDDYTAQHSSDGAFGIGGDGIEPLPTTCTSLVDDLLALFA